MAQLDNCIKCGVSRSEAEFRADTRNMCVECNRARARDYYHKYLRKPPRQMSCVYCGDSFLTKHSSRKYCSEKCQEKMQLWRVARPPQVRACSVCGSDFATTAGNRVAVCSRRCRSRRRSAIRYGMDPAEYHQALESRDGACACCGEVFKDSQRQKHVDHCHETGKVRGVLCASCNVGLGHARDSIDRLNDWQVYLARHQLDLVSLCAK